MKEKEEKGGEKKEDESKRIKTNKEEEIGLILFALIWADDFMKYCGTARMKSF